MRSQSLEVATALEGGEHKTAVMEIHVGYNHVIVKHESDDGDNWTDIRPEENLPTHGKLIAW